MNESEANKVINVTNIILGTSLYLVNMVQPDLKNKVKHQIEIHCYWTTSNQLEGTAKIIVWLNRRQTFSWRENWLKCVFDDLSLGFIAPIIRFWTFAGLTPLSSILSFPLCSVRPDCSQAQSTFSSRADIVGFLVRQVLLSSSLYWFGGFKAVCIQLNIHSSLNMCPQVDTRISPMNIYLTQAAKFDCLSCSPPNTTMKILIKK